ncbi:MAG: ribonuclease H family protein [Saprospiraceae bacterium]|nr:ribonuclease H family protein [Saprospiraceae bacterium]
MAKKNKYYVVWEGVTPGIYSSWPACQAQIKGYPNARYKGFPSRAEAEAAYQGTYFESVEKKKPVERKQVSEADIMWNSIAVDAACSGNPGLMEYRGVDTKTGTELFRQGPFKQGTNNIGEFLALVHGLALLQKEEKYHLPIYTDSRIALGWVKRKKANTKLKKTNQNAILFDLILRAEKWLADHTFDNPIIKWETKSWGEIPADFGRK